jgi:AbrB family looped-hinge helix DNA binding protein
METITVQIDGTGRVVLPKPFRERLGLRGGDSIAIELHGDALELRPTREAGQLKRVNGVLVFTGTDPIANDENFVERSRDERIQELTREIPGKR